jgi:hypothetical protein
MDTCKTCSYRVFNEELGVYICKIYNHRIRDVYKYVDCESYERKEVKNDPSRS